MAALTLVIPLSAGVFDISVPYTMTLSGVMCTYAIVNTDAAGVASGIVIAMVVALLVGVMNGVVVVVFKIDSLIGTLATGLPHPSPRAVAHGEPQRQRPRARRVVPGHRPEPVAVGPHAARVLRPHHGVRASGTCSSTPPPGDASTPPASTRTPRGWRRCAPTGCSSAACIASATLAGITGIVLASNIGSGSPTAGNSYLLPGLRRGLPRRDAAEERPLQRLGHDHRRAPARHADHRPRSGQGRRSGCSSSPPASCSSPPSPSPASRCAGRAPNRGGPRPAASPPGVPVGRARPTGATEQPARPSV